MKCDSEQSEESAAKAHQQIVNHPQCKDLVANDRARINPTSLASLHAYPMIISMILITLIQEDQALLNYISHILWI